STLTRHTPYHPLIPYTTLFRSTEADIISKFILPAIKKSGWDDMTQIREEVKLRDGKVIVRGQMAARQTVKSADIVLYHKPNLPRSEEHTSELQLRFDLVCRLLL